MEGVEVTGLMGRVDGHACKAGLFQIIDAGGQQASEPGLGHGKAPGWRLTVLSERGGRWVGSRRRPAYPVDNRFRYLGTGWGRSGPRKSRRIRRTAHPTTSTTSTQASTGTSTARM